MARPKKKINKESVEALAAHLMTLEEFAAWTDSSVSTLQRRFDQVIKRGHGKARASLRRRQFEVAMGRPGQPAEFLKDENGKLVLKDGAPIKIRDEVKPVPANVTMLIWLGKQELGQSDKFVVDEGEGGGFTFVGKR